MFNTDLPTRAELPSVRMLLRSTFVAALIAVGLLITAVLPAEYGFDPTGIGRVLGLTRMGEIKMAIADKTASENNELPAQNRAATDSTASPAAKLVVTSPPDVRVKERASTQQHIMTVRLKPGQGVEVKLTMRKDASVRYDWSTQGGTVNYNAHGDPVPAPKGFNHSYAKGQNSAGEAGILQAAFDGVHGWSWRNRSATETLVTLKTRGDYGQIKGPLDFSVGNLVE